MLTIENGPTVVFALIVFLLLAHILYPTKGGTSETPRLHPDRHSRVHRLLGRRGLERRR
jgi:hypothetical protein